MPGLVLDVGANVGEFTFAVAERNPDVTVIAFEPVLDLALRLSGGVRKRKLANVIVHGCAVAATEGERSFHLSPADRAVSSLLEFDAAHISGDLYWSQRDDLRHVAVTTVTTIRLDRVLRELKVDRIRFVKIDAQGVDVDVLRSAGRFLEVIEAGMLEVPATRQHALYSGERETLIDALNFLDDHGFVTYAIKPNDPSSNEFNVFFHRADIDPREVEASLQLKGVRLYDGKHFWREPSSTLDGVAELDQLRDSVQELRTARHELLTIEHDLRTRLHAAETATHDLRTRLHTVETADGRGGGSL